MKLDFLDDLTDNGKYSQTYPDKLIRLYDFTSDEAARLKKLIETEVISQGRSLNVRQLDFIQSINCSLQFEISEEDLGVRLPFDQKTFVCKLSISAYKTMCEIIEHFATKKSDGYGYNWLYDAGTDEIELLFSPGSVGSW